MAVKKYTTTIKDATFSEERALYNLHDAVVKSCRFEGEEDGESALKESGRLRVEDCYFDLRYPLWHVTGATILRGEMTKNCRAALWYSKDITAEECKMHGIKALRECENVSLNRCDVSSAEFGWKSRKINVTGGVIESEYAFLLAKDLFVTGLQFHGKYSFQYVENAKFSKCTLDTKDAFWHSKNVVVKDCVLRGEYLGWYSENLTLIRCKIIGTQPLCYCKGLKLVDCETENCDLAFEYSSVKASIKGGIVSIKNPHSGKIVADEVGNVILKDSVLKTHAQIFVRTSQKTKRAQKAAKKASKKAAKQTAERTKNAVKNAEDQTTGGAQ